MSLVTGRHAKNFFSQPTPAQGVISNGLDANLLYNLATLNVYALGIAPPAYAPVPANANQGGAPSVPGNLGSLAVRYLADGTNVTLLFSANCGLVAGLQLAVQFGGYPATSAFSGVFTISSVASGGLSIVYPCTAPTTDGQFVSVAGLANLLQVALTPATFDANGTYGATADETVTLHFSANSYLSVGQYINVVPSPRIQTYSAEILTVSPDGKTVTFMRPMLGGETPVTGSSGTGIYVSVTQGAASPTGDGLTGQFLYRIRWVDATTNTISLPGPVYQTPQLSDQILTLGPDPSDDPPARVTNWILERNDGQSNTFWPVNVSNTYPSGTPIGTTSFTDEFDNGSDFTGQDIIPMTQGQPPPFRWSAINNGRLFAGGVVGQGTTVSAINGSAALYLVGGPDFTPGMVGQQIIIGGTPYTIEAYVSDSELTMTDLFGGVTGTFFVSFPLPGNVGFWSEENDPESYGQPVVGTVANSLVVGDADPLLGGVGLGIMGFLWAKSSRLFYHNYRVDPSFLGDGSMYEIPARRGVLGPKCIIRIGGYVYGMDQWGMWMYQPAVYGIATPQDLGAPLHYDWQREKFDFTQGDNFHIQWDPFENKIVFWVVEVGDTYPQLGYEWDLARQTWSGTRRLPWGRTSGVEVPDSAGKLRSLSYHEALNGAQSVRYFDGIGKSFGAPLNTLLTGTATGGTSTTLRAAGLTNAAYANLAVQLTRAVDASTETQIVISNTTTALTVQGWTGAAPVAGDRFDIAPIPSRYRTGRLTCGYPQTKKEFGELWLNVKSKSACALLYVRAYLDGQATQGTWYTDYNGLAAQDGVSWNAVLQCIQVDCTAEQTRYRVPLNHVPAVDIQLEIFTIEAGAPPEILGPLEITFDVPGLEAQPTPGDRQ